MAKIIIEINTTEDGIIEDLGYQDIIFDQLKQIVCGDTYAGQIFLRSINNDDDNIPAWFTIKLEDNE